MNLFDEELAHQMIKAHEIQFGKKPDVIVFPIHRGIFFEGVKVEFHFIPQYFSCDQKNCLHHDFGRKSE